MKEKKISFVPFKLRHNGTEEGINEMLEVIGVGSVDELIDETVPDSIKIDRELDLPAAQDEHEFLRNFRALAAKNDIYRSYIGMGYYNTYTPNVILRNILENPGWYTAYTPYQAEIAQGRLEALINFQTMVSDLTGMELANASLLDEGTAAAEAMTMLHASRPRDKKKSEVFLVDENTFPQTIDVLRTRALPIGIQLEVTDCFSADLDREDVFGLMIQYPNDKGEIFDPSVLIQNAKEKSLQVSVATDLLSLVMLKSPGEMGADVVIGSSQRFGVPMAYGGPHAAFFATHDAYKRKIPGRIIGVSQDAYGKTGYRMALQTREQHIRREKATSNICTAQVLLAVISGAYAVYHGPEGLRRIAERVHSFTLLLNHHLRELGYTQANDIFYDTLLIRGAKPDGIKEKAEAEKINFRYFENGDIGISLDETTLLPDVEDILKVFGFTGELEFRDYTSPIKALERTDEILTHPVFNSYQTEHEMLRYLKRLENKDLSLVHSMISLGSCTMKLNATAEMIPISWPEFSQLHPFAPVTQTAGYQELFVNLRKWLSEITGFADVSLQPNSGAQGEYSGLMVIKAYHDSRGEGNRDVTLIPTSAHGTNPASAVMAGKEVVLVECDNKGNIDVEDLKAKAEKYSERLSALMVTYPSTHGVFESDIRLICDIIHQHGGQVYMDGANLNAQVGITTPGLIGADVCHLNLHKTFCIPHGGGGPGMGPIGVAEHLVPFLPSNPVIKTGGEKAITSISSAPWGSAGILPISYAYIALMGPDGLTEATKRAIVNANYIKSRLENDYPILYTGEKGRAAHEMIVDCRDFKKAGIEVEDIAKRLMDYGYHAPTVSFPVPGTMMIEPTESETVAELDRFCEALLSIREEIREVEIGLADEKNNVLKNAPHTAEIATADHWDFSYSREKAVYPLHDLRANKFWPAVSRIDNAYGDRHLFCSCVPIDLLVETEVAKE